MQFESLTICLLPGLDGSGHLFTEFATALAARTPKCIVDYPLRTEWEISDYVEHIDQCLPADEDLLIIAESFSGPLALELLRRRSNIKALVLVASFARCPNPILRLMRFVPLATLKPLLKSSTAIRAFCLGGQATPEQINNLKSVIDGLPLEILKCRLNLLGNLKVEIASIRDSIPILHLLAGNDRLVQRSSAPDLSDAHPDSRVITVNGPHFLLQSRAVECAILIRNWADSLGRDPA